MQNSLFIEDHKNTSSYYDNANPTKIFVIFAKETYLTQMKPQVKSYIKDEGQFLTVFLPIVIFKEKDTDYFMAACLPLDIYSAGNTIAEAESAINEHIELFLEETTRMGTLQECLIDLGWKFKSKDIAVINPPKTTLSEVFQKFGNHLLSVTNRKTNIPLPC